MFFVWYDTASAGDYLRSLHEFILDAKQLGITLAHLKRLMQTKHSFFCQRMTALLRLLDILLKSKLVLSVGVVERVYVAHEFKQHWVIQSYKNQKGRGFVASQTYAAAAADTHANDKDDDDDDRDDNEETTASPMVGLCVFSFLHE